MGGGEAVQGVRGAGEDYIRLTISRFTRRRNVCLLWILIICRSVYRGTFFLFQAFSQRGRATITTDLIEQIQPAFQRLFESETCI